jgi:hypothetical protein
VASLRIGVGVQGGSNGGVARTAGQHGKDKREKRASEKTIAGDFFLCVTHVSITRVTLC